MTMNDLGARVHGANHLSMRNVEMYTHCIHHCIHDVVDYIIIPCKECNIYIYIYYLDPPRRIYSGLCVCLLSVCVNEFEITETAINRFS